MGNWGFRLEMPKLEPLKRELLNADLNFYCVQTRWELAKQIEKFNNDRNLRFKILTMLKRFVPAVGSVQDFLASMKMASDLSKDFIAYKIEDLPDKTAMELRFNPVAVELMDMMKTMGPKFFGKMMPSKETIRNKFTTELRKTYETDFVMSELS